MPGQCVVGITMIGMRFFGMGGVVFVFFKAIQQSVYL